MNHTRTGLVCLLIAFLLTSASLAQETKTASIFADHMVLQRELPVNIWGSGKPGGSVTVEFAGQKKTGTVDKDGRWQVTLDPLEASVESRELLVRTSGSESVVKITDILVGEVWIGSGQSNMAMGMSGTQNAGAAISKADDNLLRLFRVKQIASPDPLTTVDGEWFASAPNKIGGFSAAGYFFGRDLRKATNVPVGIIITAWGGTPARAWTPRSVLAAEPTLKKIVEAYEKSLETWDPDKAQKQYEEKLAEAKIAIEKAKADGTKPPQLPKPPVHPGANQNSAGSLYNGMVAPLVPMTFRGVIWYQGEADSGSAPQYRVLFPTLIKSWREAFGRDLPFLFVQIAPHKGMSPNIRDAQLYCWRTVPNTAMIVITDHGDAEDIHPKAKEPVGVRLALAARALVYGEKIVYSGPVYDSVTFEGPRGILSFQHTGTGLVAQGGALRGFEIAGADGKFVPASASIEGTQVVVQSDKVADPKAIRFGWANVPDTNLFNAEGLPATPFRTDEPK